MKFDTVIIGGGLAGLSAGIELVRAGRKTAIISAGQSALHFSSGSMELMSYDADGKPVEHPLEAMASLPATHPYSIMGVDNVKRLLPKVKPLFEECGVKVTGDHDRNHQRITPIGELKPAWLTIDDYLTLDFGGAMPWKKVAIVNVDGYLDFFPRFVVRAFDRNNVEVVATSVTVNAIHHLHESTTEMRSTNIARVLSPDAVGELAKRLNEVDSSAEVIFFPAVVGFDDFRASHRLKELVRRPLYYMTTLGVSVPGVRAQIMMRKQFKQMGGAYMLGDTVLNGEYDSTGRLKSVMTANFGSDRLEAENFIFAAGSFFSHGLTSTPAGVFEPVLGLDVDAPKDRTKWFDKNIYHPQPYNRFGVLTDADGLHAMRGGHRVDNVLVAGSSLPGADALREGSGGGIAILTALHAAETILKK